MVMRLRVYIAAVLIALGAGCVSPNVDPKGPARHTGYTDFYVDSPEVVCWQVVRMDDPSGEPVNLYEEYEPLEDRILRLAFAPGEYYLRISVLNHVVIDPARVVVDVKDGKITPVRVTLKEVGTTQVETRTVRVGGTYYGRYGRGTKLRLRAYGALKVNAVSLESVPYQTKAGMPYSQFDTNLVQSDSGIGSR
jgi:hypothetical protein